MTDPLYKAQKAWRDFILEQHRGHHLCNSFSDWLREHHEEFSMQDFIDWLGEPGEREVNNYDWQSIIKIKREALLKIWTEP